MPLVFTCSRLFCWRRHKIYFEQVLAIFVWLQVSQWSTAFRHILMLKKLPVTWKKKLVKKLLNGRHGSDNLVFQMLYLTEILLTGKADKVCCNAESLKQYIILSISSEILNLARPHIFLGYNWHTLFGYFSINFLGLKKIFK